jgi:hypothetical protein
MSGKSLATYRQRSAGRNVYVNRIACAERCGYGDLQEAVSAVDVWGLDAADGELRGWKRHEGIGGGDERQE